MEKTEAEKLLQRYIDGEATAKERAIVHDWYNHASSEQHAEDLPVADLQMVKKRLDTALNITGQSVIKPVYRFLAAASVLLMLGYSVYFFADQQRDENRQITYSSDVPAGNNAATLTLSNGRKINLNDLDSGALASQSGILVSKTNSGQLIYKAAGSPEGGLQFNTIETPRGGKYQVILSDGTQVWLNAGSTLKFPASFAQQKDRKVTLTGEAYFEVVHDANKPFKVITAGQITEDIGTAFNISAYTDEKTTKTTIVEGSASINGSVVLKAGEQGLLYGKKISVKRVNTEEAIAWKNGYFMFESEKIESIMRKIARWYNVDIVFEGSMPEDTFSGTVNRSANVSEVLKNLELTDKVHFSIQGRSIMVKN